MPNKTRVLGVRLDGDAYEKLEQIEKLTQIEKVTLARAAIMAAIESWEKNQKLEFPIKFSIASK